MLKSTEHTIDDDGSSDLHVKHALLLDHAYAALVYRVYTMSNITIGTLPVYGPVVHHGPWKGEAAWAQATMRAHKRTC